jgi:D-arabinose 1-dehydrogenase-like Zn-dependent alcohol dehydrogenase
LAASKTIANICTKRYKSPHREKVKAMTETYSLDEISKAYERVADGKVRFRAVITTSN